MIKKFLQKIFKTLGYSVFHKIYGKIDKSIDCYSDERIKVKSTNIEDDLNYKIYEIDSGRLYTDRIHDTAIILNNQIVDGPSFQLRYKPTLEIYNSNVSHNIVFKKGTPRILKNFNGVVASLLTGGAGNSNYWHWLFDVLPRIELLKKNMSLSEIDYYLVPSLKKKFQQQSLDMLGVPYKKRLTSEKNRHIKAKKIIVTDHPVVTSGDSSSDIQNMPSWIILWLKNNFLKNTSLQKKRNKIYIDREDSISSKDQRLINNENEVREFLLKKGFALVKLADLNFKEQIELFNSAETIVGLHGAGFSNIVFCDPGTKVVELRNSTSGLVLKNLAKKNNLNYNSITVGKKNLVNSKKVSTKDINNKPLELTIEISKYAFVNQQGNIEVPINELSKII